MPPGNSVSEGHWRGLAAQNTHVQGGKTKTCSAPTTVREERLKTKEKKKKKRASLGVADRIERETGFSCGLSQFVTVGSC